VLLFSFSHEKVIYEKVPHIEFSSRVLLHEHLQENTIVRTCVVTLKNIGTILNKKNLKIIEIKNKV
jgi:hypothetical protein